MITGIELVLDVLRKHVKIPVVNKVPDKRPALFIRVDQAAPTILSPVHQRVRVIVQVYGEDLDRVLDYAFVVRNILEDIGLHHPKAFGGCDELTGPEEYPDPDLVRMHRWQLTGIIYMTSQ